jgi:DNA end-binding protein Ku
LARKFGISFGLVNIPVQIHNTVKEETISFHMVTAQGHRVKHKLVDAETGEEVNRPETLKGYEVSKDKMVILTPDEVANVRLASTKSIEIIGFVPSTYVDPILQKGQYYITPDGKAGEKGYSILYHVLKELGVMAVGKIVMGGTKEYIATVSVWKNMLLLTLLYSPHEVVAPPTINIVEVNARELELGKTLLQSLGKPEFKELKNRYIKALQELITAKLEGKEIKPIKVQETAEDDIAAALEKSLSLTKKKKLGVAVAATADGSAEMVEV